MRTKRKSVIQADDLEIGQFYTVHGLKNSEQSVPVAGMAFKLLAMNLRCIVGKLICDPNHAPLTIDTRYLNLDRYG